MSAILKLGVLLFNYWSITDIYLLITNVCTITCDILLFISVVLNVTSWTLEWVELEQVELEQVELECLSIIKDKRSRECSIWILESVLLILHHEKKIEERK